MNEKLYFEELETVEELGWVEGVCGIALGVGGAIVPYVYIAT